MKALVVDIIIGRISSRKDGSVSFSGETPEFTDEEFAIFRKLQNHVLKTTFVPLDNLEEGAVEVTTEHDEKTPSQRQRAIMYIVWKKLFSKKIRTFDEFYKRSIEKSIDQYKAMLD